MCHSLWLSFIKFLPPPPPPPKRGADKCHATLLGVTQQSNTSKNPVIRMLWSLQVQAENVSQVSTSGLLVHRTLIKFQCVWVIFEVLNQGGSINCINVHHREGSKQNFRGRLREPAVSSIPPSAIQEQAMHVDSFRWRWRHVFFYHLSDVIGKCNVIEVATLCQKNILPQDFALESKPRLFFFFYLQ